MVCKLGVATFAHRLAHRLGLVADWMHLAILHRRFVVATTMTGLWDGQSVRQQSSEATNWSDCNLIFDVAGNITGIVIG